MERVSRVEVMTIDTHHLTQTHEHILREVDYRIGAVEKKLGNWVPPEVYHTDISNLVARLDYVTRELDALRNANDSNMRWVVNKFKKMRVAPSHIVAPPQPCPMPARQLTPGMGDFPPGPLTAPPLVLGSPDSEVQKKMQKKE